jgi:acyl-CoA synthetase (AMP-forming)/AMP-acid ligase II
VLTRPDVPAASATTRSDTAVHELPTLDDYLKLYASERPTALAVVGEQERLTYAELDLEVERYAGALAARGIGGGDVVAVLGFSRPECVVAFLATCRVGAVFLGLSPKHTERELAFVLKDSRPRLLFGMHSRGEPEQDTKLATLKGSGFEAMIVTRGGPVPGLSESLDSFLEAGALQAGRSRASSDAACAIVYTSGSTGTPKGALLSQRGMIRSALLTWEHWYGGVQPLRAVAQHPINHVGWLICECVATLVPGGTMFCQERFHGAGTLRLIERERLNLWLAFPSMLILAKETPEFEDCDLSSLETIALGMPASVELMRAYRDRTGAVMCISYGLTEANGGSVTVTARDAELETIATTIGRPVPGIQVCVMGFDGKPAGAGEEGEFLVRDRSVFLGYLNRPDATAEALDRDGWLHTGDVVCTEASGEMRMVGRLKEMFKSGGYNVYPTEIESVIASHPEVAAVAVVEIPDPLWQEVGVAYVVSKEGVALNEETLRSYARHRLANYKVPKRFVLVDALPQLPNGKFDKVALRAQAGNG